MFYVSFCFYILYITVTICFCQEFFFILLKGGVS
nr:MAG TPA: hypothetical protein [Caudoviricetes sp.]